MALQKALRQGFEALQVTASWEQVALPEITLQVSLVQLLLSSQVKGVTTHCPFVGLHTWGKHAFDWSHVAYVNVHTALPATSTHVSFVHWLLSSQLTGVPLQTPSYKKLISFNLN